MLPLRFLSTFMLRLKKWACSDIRSPRPPPELQRPGTLVWRVRENSPLASLTLTGRRVGSHACSPDWKASGVSSYFAKQDREVEGPAWECMSRGSKTETLEGDPGKNPCQNLEDMYLASRIM